MSGKPIQITEFDLQRLRKLLLDAQSTAHRRNAYVDRLREEIERAQVRRPEEISGEVITMNTKAVLEDLDGGEDETYTLVFPEDADLSNRRISVLAPIGTAMLGYEVGDTFEWDVPAGKRHMRVKKIVYQPEAAGDYQL